MKELNTFICIVRRKSTDKFADFFKKYGVDQFLTINCEGTAKYKTLDLLGVEQVEKTMFFALLTKERKRLIIRRLRTEMDIDSPGTGIGLALPVDGVGGQTFLNFLSGGEPLAEREDPTMDTEYELIIAIATRGGTDAVMDAAREAGAGGGTVIRSKGTQSHKKGGFFNISLADEKEVIMIVSRKSKRNDIMTSIMDKAGLGTPSRAVVFSVPVTETAGLRLIEEQEAELAESQAATDS